MDIDNSAFVTFQRCPLKYFERYEVKNDDVDGSCGLELDQPVPDRDFGTRFHQLLHEYRAQLLGSPIPRYPEWPDAAIEAECQSVLAGYFAHYPVEPLTILSAERVERVPIPGTQHRLIVRIDAVVRFNDGTIGPLDTKTEHFGSASNSRESWAARSQASFYLWALQQLHPEERVTRLVVDVVTRGNSKRPPHFWRMDDISRTPEQLEESIRNLVKVADDIEAYRRGGWWPRNDNHCKDGWRRCDYYSLHILGRTEANLKLYRPARNYLEL